MNLKEGSVSATYLPVAWEYREVIEEAIAKKADGKIFYFCSESGICESKGTIVEMKEFSGEGMFIVMANNIRIRIDTIITLFGRPGAAYTQYDSYSSACMECMGGYEEGEL